MLVDGLEEEVVSPPSEDVGVSVSIGAEVDVKVSPEPEEVGVEVSVLEVVEGSGDKVVVSVRVVLLDGGVRVGAEEEDEGVSVNPLPEEVGEGLLLTELRLEDGETVEVITIVVSVVTVDSALELELDGAELEVTTSPALDVVELGAELEVLSIKQEQAELTAAVLPTQFSRYVGMAAVAVTTAVV